MQESIDLEMKLAWNFTLLKNGFNTRKTVQAFSAARVDQRKTGQSMNGFIIILYCDEVILLRKRGVVCLCSLYEGLST